MENTNIAPIVNGQMNEIVIIGHDAVINGIILEPGVYSVETILKGSSQQLLLKSRRKEKLEEIKLEAIKDFAYNIPEHVEISHHNKTGFEKFYQPKQKRGLKRCHK